MTTLPSHYRHIYRSFIRLACWMIFFALISGILFQESSKKIPFQTIPVGLHWESMYHLALVHGHVFLIGVLIPLAVLVMLQFALVLGGEPASEKLLKWGAWLYHFGAGLTVFLMLYKGYHFLISVRMHQLDFAIIDHNFFGGQLLLRHLVYGISHTAMSVGLIFLAIAILRTLPKRSPAIPTGVDAK